jgi:hypothetical protein
VRGGAGQAGQFFELKKKHKKQQQRIKMLSALSLSSDPPRLIIGLNADGHAASYRSAEVSCVAVSIRIQSVSQPLAVPLCQKLSQPLILPLCQMLAQPLALSR